MSAYRDEDPRIHAIKTQIRVVPNFPKPGLLPLYLVSVFFLFRLFIFIACRETLEKFCRKKDNLFGSLLKAQLFDLTKVGFSIASEKQWLKISFFVSFP